MMLRLLFVWFLSNNVVVMVVAAEMAVAVVIAAMGTMEPVVVVAVLPHYMLHAQCAADSMHLSLIHI